MRLGWHQSIARAQGRGKQVIDWLLDSDPSIRWQVKRDLAGEPAEVVAVERSRVAVEGWGARLLGLQEADGNWGGGPWVYQSWTSTMETLMLLRELGLDPASPQARKAIGLVRDKSNWGPHHGHSPFFEGEVEPCINGRVLACGAYFGEASDRLVDRLLGEQLEDGGWNCDAPPSKRSSFNSTICVLEGLLEYEKAKGANSAVEDARRRGQEYLLERKLFRSLSTGRVIDRDRKSDRDWREFSFPTRWHYDVLWALDYLARKPGPVPMNERLRPSTWWLRSNSRTDDGRSITSTPARSTSTWREAAERRAAGTRFVPCGCWTGIHHGVGRMNGRPLLSMIDHLVVASSDLQKTISELASVLGVVAVPGGRHPKWRTQNALLSLGPRLYLEIMGPDDSVAEVENPRPFGIDQMASRRLVTWVARSSNLQRTVATAEAEGIDLGEIQHGSRQRPDGTLLEWRMTDLLMDREGGVVPYFIDWGKTAHPGASAPAGCLLEGLKVFHPRSAWITMVLGRLGLDIVAEEGPAAVEAHLVTPKGRIILR